LFIPIILQGAEVSFTTRAIHDNGLRYISAAESEEAVSHKEILYGEEHCAQTVVVVEGPLDVWAGGPGFACTFGTAFTPAQLLRISRYPRKILCYDSGDSAGELAVAGLAAALAVMPGTTEIVKLHTGKDAASADYDEIIELRRYAFGSEEGCGRIRNL
jgi:DNA primase